MSEGGLLSLLGPPRKLCVCWGSLGGGVPHKVLKLHPPSGEDSGGPADVGAGLSSQHRSYCCQWEHRGAAMLLSAAAGVGGSCASVQEGRTAMVVAARERLRAREAGHCEAAAAAGIQPLLRAHVMAAGLKHTERHCLRGGGDGTGPCSQPQHEGGEDVPLTQGM